MPGPRLLLRQHADVYNVFNTALPGLCFFCDTAMAVALLTTGMVLPVLVFSLLGVGLAGWAARHPAARQRRSGGLTRPACLSAAATARYVVPVRNASSRSA